MVLFGMLSETLNKAVVCIVQNGSYVKKVVFPLEVLPFVQLGTAFVQAAISTGLLVGANLCLHGFISPTVLLVPVAIVPLTLMVLGFSWIVASVGAYVRDAVHVVGLGTMALIYVSPVFYSVDAVRERNAVLATLIRLNPLTVPLENFRAAILGPVLGGAPAPWFWTVGHAAASVAIAWAGLAFFQRTKRGFADVV